MNLDEIICKWFKDSNLFYVTSINMDGTYKYVNPFYSKTFGYEENYLVGKPFHVTMHPDDIKVCEDCSTKCFTFPDKSFNGVIRKHDNKGGYVITKWEFKALFNDKNEPTGMLCVGNDITESMAEKKALLKVTRDLDKTQSVLSQKDEHIHQITYELSHVMRKPLANILGLAMMLENSELDYSTKHAIKLILDCALELDNVVIGNSNPK